MGPHLARYVQLGHRMKDDTGHEFDRHLDRKENVRETAQRRLGLRMAVNCWALLRARGTSLYAQVLELSATGVVLRLVGLRSQVRFRCEQRFGLDLFVPGSPTPVHATVRPVRAVGSLEAFELVEISAMDRLTLAEYLDSLSAKPRVMAHVRPNRPGTLPVRA